MLLTDTYCNTPIVQQLVSLLKTDTTQRIHIPGLTGSLKATLIAATLSHLAQRNHIIIAADKESACYLQNDLEHLLDDTPTDPNLKRILLFPESYRKIHAADNHADNANVLMRTEVVKQLHSGRYLTIVTYAEALAERVPCRTTLAQHSLTLHQGAHADMDTLTNTLQDYDFERVDFVAEPGQYAVRGGIIDVYSYANNDPYRIEFFDDQIDSLRTFDPVSQLSLQHHQTITILPNLEHTPTSQPQEEAKVNLLNYLSPTDVVWADELMMTLENIDKRYHTAQEAHAQVAATATIAPVPLDSLYCDAHLTLTEILRCHIVEYSHNSYYHGTTLTAHSERQPLFHKQFDMLISNLNDYLTRGYRCLLGTSAEAQRKRLEKIFHNSAITLNPQHHIEWLPFTLKNGYIDHDNHLLCYTDHEIFERYHKYTVQDLSQNRESLTLKELLELKPGDYVTHIDYGIGRFAGLEKIDNNGKTQEVIRLVYKNNDTLYISIHSLHKISRYVGKEGTEPTLHRLGSTTWQTLKNRTKKQVKDIARDLIQLYAKRKASQGFAFSPDSYLQNELEASFLYEDTPDQLKATRDVKHDMEASAPMDRLVCGDVGFGKTEIAIRAAFKAVCDSKQVAVLVPSTLLAFQHYNTFCDRLQGLPVNIDYLNRFRTTADKRRILQQLKEGKIDILIGTHAITGKEVQFHDLGLIIVDEEQKFGVSAKEKLRQMKVNVDSLTLTATPIPRTLQFSLMGARDLSIIQTPPPNRQPIDTELCVFNEETIRDAISFELSRGGQVFFVSNRVENLDAMADLVRRLVPDARIAIAHGQMEGKAAEETLMRFLEGEVDVLVATSIVENGLDIPSANTIIVNNAQQFGLSDLHQMRGRVGRSNRKAFCYLLVPSFQTLTADAQKRLRAIAEFSSIGSGFNIAMRDLDIRGAGNILGAEQSGFISDIGYDAYHKILNEAIEELKEEDFRDLFAPEPTGTEEHPFVKECIIETDLSVLIPDHYVTSVSQRLQLYKELNSLNTEEELRQYREHLRDRFGTLPQETEELVQTITLRRMAMQLGMERLVLKQNAMVCYFVGNASNPFFQSTVFRDILTYISHHPNSCHLRENPQRLTLRCDHIEHIAQAVATLREMQHPTSTTLWQVHQKAATAQEAMTQAQEKNNIHRTTSTHNLKKIGEHRL